MGKRVNCAYYVILCVLDTHNTHTQYICYVCFVCPSSVPFRCGVILRGWSITPKKEWVCFALTGPKKKGCDTMGHKNKLSLVGQVNAALSSRLAIGENKHKDKRAGQTAGKIYSWETFRTYQKHCIYFTQWAKEKYGCKSLADARPYASEWLQERAKAGYSTFTLKMQRSALGKLYGVPGASLGDLPQRSRSSISRSRGAAVRDSHFSRSNNALLVAVGECAGLRRAEMRALRGSQLVRCGDGFGIRVDRASKGGKVRVAPLVGPPAQVAQVVQACRSAGPEKVFPQGIHSGADVHGLRAVYACRVYDLHARPYDVVKRSGDLYRCRGDLRGVWYDKAAMLQASRALGHNRISVIAQSYLYRV